VLEAVVPHLLRDVVGAVVVLHRDIELVLAPQLGEAGALVAAGTHRGLLHSGTPTAHHVNWEKSLQNLHHYKNDKEQSAKRLAFNRLARYPAPQFEITATASFDFVFIPMSRVLSGTGRSTRYPYVAAISEAWSVVQSMLMELFNACTA
jgi:hypothetical protein